MANKLILPETHKPFPNEHDWKKVNNIWDNKNIDRKNILSGETERNCFSNLSYQFSKSKKKNQSCLSLTVCQKIQKMFSALSTEEIGVVGILINLYSIMISWLTIQKIIIVGEKTLQQLLLIILAIIAQLSIMVATDVQADLGILKNKK